MTNLHFSSEVVTNLRRSQLILIDERRIYWKQRACMKDSDSFYNWNNLWQFLLQFHSEKYMIIGAIEKSKSHFRICSLIVGKYHRSHSKYHRFSSGLCKKGVPCSRQHASVTKIEARYNTSPFLYEKAFLRSWKGMRPWFGPEKFLLRRSSKVRNLSISTNIENINIINMWKHIRKPCVDR